MVHPHIYQKSRAFVENIWWTTLVPTSASHNHKETEHSGNFHFSSNFPSEFLHLSQCMIWSILCLCDHAPHHSILLYAKKVCVSQNMSHNFHLVGVFCYLRFKKKKIIWKIGVIKIIKITKLSTFLIIWSIWS